MTTIARAGLALALIMLAPASKADGLRDLRQALVRLQSPQQPVSARLGTEVWRRVGQGRDAHESSGNIETTVEDSTNGLQMQIDATTLGHIDTEQRISATDPGVATPGLTALKELDIANVPAMLSAASGLMQMLDQARFKDEQAAVYKAQPVRRLRFELPLQTLSEHDRQYVSQFENTVELWIDDAGTPLASRTSVRLSGRAFLVVRFEQDFEENCDYQRIGDRLVTLRKQMHDTGRGAGEQLERRVIRTLRLQS